MLSKRVCQSCLRKYNIDWDAEDDALWEQLMVYCPSREAMNMFCETPKHCEFRLEHILDVQSNAE